MAINGNTKAAATVSSVSSRRSQYDGQGDPKLFIDQQMAAVDPVVAELIRRELTLRVARVIRQLAYQLGTGRLNVSIYGR